MLFLIALSVLSLGQVDLTRLGTDDGAADLSGSAMPPTPKNTKIPFPARPEGEN